LEIIVAIEGISQSKIQYSQQVLKQTTLQAIYHLKATYYTDGSNRDNMVGYGVYCEEDGLAESYNICEDIPISAVQLTAIQMAMQHISGQEAKSYTHRLTDGMLDAPKGTGR
jgi:hypothetical protein